MKLLLIGVDGLDYRAYVTFGRHGQCRPLRSPIPVTGPSWTSLYTGMSANAHKVWDVFGFFREGKAVHARNLADKCVWAYLPDAVGVGLYTLPVAYPPTRPVLRFYVPGFPASYAPELNELADPPLIDWGVRDSVEALANEGWWRGKTAFNVFPELLNQHGAMTGHFIKLVKERSVDFGAIGYRWIDRVTHVLGGRRREWAEAEHQNILLLDLLIDLLLEQLEPEAWMIVSDHGTFRSDHTALGVVATGGALAGVLDARRWWSVVDPAHLVAEYFGSKLPVYTEECLDDYGRYVAAATGQKAVWGKIDKLLASGSPLRLNLGCGRAITDEPGWVNMDAIAYPGVDIVHDLYNGLPFPCETISEIKAFDVLEHLSYVMHSVILGEWCRVLRPGGVLKLRSPDLGSVARAYAAGGTTFLDLLQRAYGRACSMDFDTHFSGIDWPWIDSQLRYWGCREVVRVPDSVGDRHALNVEAVKGEVAEPKGPGSYIGSEVVREHLAGLGYL